MRPIYEKASDRAKETEVARRVAEALGRRMKRCPRLSPLDWKIIDRDDRVLGYAEIKTRTNARLKYPTYMISQKKTDAAMNAARTERVKVYLVVAFTDGDAVTLLSEAPDRYDTGGRKDRNDPQDIERVAHYSMSRFVPLADIKGLGAVSSRSDQPANGGLREREPYSVVRVHQTADIKELASSPDAVACPAPAENREVVEPGPSDTGGRGETSPQKPPVPDSTLCLHRDPDLAWWYEANPELRCARCVLGMQAVTSIVEVPGDQRKRLWENVVARSEARPELNLFERTNVMRFEYAKNVAAWATARVLGGALSVHGNTCSVTVGAARLVVLYDHDWIGGAAGGYPLAPGQIGVVARPARGSKIDKNGAAESIEVVGWVMQNSMEPRPMAILRESIGGMNAA